MCVYVCVSLYVYVYVYVLTCILVHMPMCTCLHVVDDFAQEIKMRELLYGLKNQSKTCCWLVDRVLIRKLEFLMAKVPKTGGRRQAYMWGSKGSR